MDLSPKDAQEALGEIERVQGTTRKALEEGPGGAILIVWGIIWALGYLGMAFLREKANWVWAGLNVVGIVTTLVIVYAMRSRVRSRYDWRIGVFWFLLFVYGFIWLSLLAPVSPFQFGAFLPTLVMFAYVVLGLFFWRYLLWIGLVTTALTVGGYFLLPPWHFCIWMAFVGGGSLIVPGLHLRLRRS